MTEFDIGSVTTPTTLTDFSVKPQTTDGVGDQNETRWYNQNFTKWYGNYKSIAKLKIPINAYATWVVGKGWTATNTTDKVILESITGWGEDTFLSILWNMLVIKKVNGDSFAEIMRNDNGRLINIKPLDPSSIVTVVDSKGIILRYEQISKVKGKENRTISIQNMLHFSNDRVADNIHGSSVVEAVEWNIAAQEEPRQMFRKKVKHNGVLGVIEADTQDTTEMTELKKQIKKAMEEGLLLQIPKGVMEAKNWVSNRNTQEIIQWLNYLDDEFFMQIGIPKVILGGSSENEGDKKMSYLAFEQVYKREISELKADIWNQLYIKVEFDEPASLQNQLADNQLKNTSQVGFQPNDTTAGVGE